MKKYFKMFASRGVVASENGKALTEAEAGRVAIEETASGNSLQLIETAFDLNDANLNQGGKIKVTLPRR